MGRRGGLGIGKGPGGATALLLDRLIARYDLTRDLQVWAWYMAGCMALFVTGGFLTRMGGKPMALVVLVVFAVMLTGGAAGAIRTHYVLGHDCASPRWLHVVRGLLGDDGMTSVLVALQQRHSRNPSYVISAATILSQGH